MAQNVQVNKKGDENALKTIQGFTKKVKESGILNRVRSLRYNQRELSVLKRKRTALRNIDKKAEYIRLAKLGKKTRR